MEEGKVERFYVHKGIRLGNNNKKIIEIEFLDENKKRTGETAAYAADAADKNRLGHIYRGTFDEKTGQANLNRKYSHGAINDRECWAEWTALQNQAFAAAKKEKSYRKDYLDDLYRRLYQERKIYTDAVKRGDLETAVAMRDLVMVALTKEVK